MSQRASIGSEGKKRSAENFMRQFRDSATKELKKLNSVQFMEVWTHYDRDGEPSSLVLPRSLVSYFLVSRSTVSRPRDRVTGDPCIKGSYERRMKQRERERERLEAHE